MTKKHNKQLQKEREEIFKIYRKTEFFQFDSEIVHQQIIPYATYAPWESDLNFKELYKNVQHHTLVDVYRCHELWTLAQNVKNMEGDILEVGAWRGGTGAILCKASEGTDTKIFLADTFTGVVKATEEDTVYRGGEHADTSEKMVLDLLQEFNLNNATILKGIFPDDFPNVDIQKLKICHIDVDTFLSAKDIFEYSWGKIVVGGMVVFDDYGFWTCEGITKYFNSLNPTDGVKIHNLNGHGIIIKTK